MTTTSLPKVRIYHNGLWAKYKGAIFSKVFAASARYGLITEFVQTSETNTQRAMLGDVDRSYHQYPYQLLFRGFSNNIRAYQMAIALVRNVLRHRNDMVVIPGYHRAEYWAMLAACILLRRKRAVFVDSTAYESAGQKGWKESAKAIFFRHCHGFFCYGIRSRDYVMSYGVDERKISFRCQAAALPHGYEIASIRDHYARSQPRPRSFTRFLYFGRLAQEKGIYDLLTAFSQVRAQIPDVTLSIVGSGLIERELKERTKQLDLDSVVEFLGSKNLEQIGELLLDSAAMVLPSHIEPWGLVVNESLSYGCPVVVSNICGCVPELVHEGRTGYSFPVGDGPALCAAMIAAVGLSKDRQRVSTDCLDLIEQYTPERAAEEILSGCVRVIKISQ